ncbi:Transglutaminase-like superfamily protein [Lachnospiraceae bacterium C10]|nr:Transglutaminase-like superfamily protein [Lachnospiraceae bacterium C10]
MIKHRILRKLRTATALMLSCALLFTAYPAQAKVAKSLSSVSLTSTELSKYNGSIKATINNTKNILTFSLKGCRQYANRALTCDCAMLDEKPVVVNSSGNASIQADLTRLKQSTIWVCRSDQAYQSDNLSMIYTGFFQLNISKKSGKYVFFSPAGKSEKTFRNTLNKKYSPKTKRTPYFAQNLKYASQIKATTKSIIKGCKSKEDKAKAIHDWLATNIQYNYAALSSHDGSNIQWNSADPDWVFKHKKAICSGFSRLARVMYTYAGIPCLNIVGTGHSITAGKDHTNPNHEWNALYLDGSWRIVDITWDCPNAYYGKNHPENIKGQAPRYSYYGITPFVLGMDHISLSVM